jgi:hypothetical protein
MGSENFERFRKSMQIGYLEWHDGISYDLESLAGLNDDERVAAENLLLARKNQDWRDIEALDCLGTPRATASLCEALVSPSFEVRIAAATRLSLRGLLDEQRIEAMLLETLPAATLANGLTSVLRLAAAHPTVSVRRKLLWCSLHGHDDARPHAAALVHYLSGLASEPFDWKHRPFYLRFGSKDLEEREDAFLELCAAIGEDAKKVS